MLTNPWLGAAISSTSQLRLLNVCIFIKTCWITQQFLETFFILQLSVQYWNIVRLSGGIICPRNSPASLNQYRRGRFAQYTERLDRCRTIAYFIVVTLHPYKSDVPNKQKVSLHQFWTNLHACIISPRNNMTTLLLLACVRRSNFQCHLQGQINLTRL